MRIHVDHICGIAKRLLFQRIKYFFPYLCIVLLLLLFSSDRKRNEFLNKIYVCLRTHSFYSFLTATMSIQAQQQIMKKTHTHNQK